MHTRPLVRISLLAVAVAAVALSCTLDYILDFELGDIAFGVDNVEVDYTLHNACFRSIDNAAINIRVTADDDAGDPHELELWTPPVDLSVGETVSGTLRFEFGYSIYNPVVVEVVGAGWDETSSGE
jgi:hypothetical protein